MLNDRFLIPRLKRSGVQPKEKHLMIRDTHCKHAQVNNNAPKGAQN